MTLIKTSLLNAIAVAIKMLTMLGINKILAIYVGPAGYAAIGNFQNAVQMITTLASGAINTGVTKYTAEYQLDEYLQRKVWQTAGSIALIGSLLTGLLVAILHRRLASWFLDDPKYGSVFVWLGLTLVFFVFNALLLAILNGKKEIGNYVIVNITGSVISLLISVLMVERFGLYGALLTLAINQSLIFFVTLVVCYRTKWFKFKYIIGSIDKKSAKNLSKFAAMAIASAVTLPVSHILVRNILGDKLGLDAAGYWEAMWRLSAAYLMFVITTLSVYYLPRLSELTCVRDIKREISNGYKIILPIVAILGTAMYFCRELIINLLFSKEFLPIGDMLFWQIVGDFLKVGAFIVAHLMIVKTLAKEYIFFEILFSCSFVILVYFFLVFLDSGINGVAYSYAINYLFYWIFVSMVVNNKLLRERE